MFWDDKPSETIVFFPLMHVEKVYSLRNGKIGPAKFLIKSYPILQELFPALTRSTVDGENIQEPTVAITVSSNKALSAELDCIAFLAAIQPQHQAEDEIFGQKITFTTHKSEAEDFLSINGFVLGPTKFIHNLRLPDFPKAYFRWDKEPIDRFEQFLSNALTDELYLAIVECLSKVDDKEAQRERSRIIIAISLFKQAFVDFIHIRSFSGTQFILLASAFEALLNLPSRDIRNSFENSVMLLTGGKTSLLKKWCQEFYDYRSNLVHGDVAWETEDAYFELPGGKKVGHSAVARNIFVQCLKAKLFLLGLLTNYAREEFDFDSLT